MDDRPGGSGGAMGAALSEERSDGDTAAHTKTSNTSSHEGKHHTRLLRVVSDPHVTVGHGQLWTGRGRC